MNNMRYNTDQLSNGLRVLSKKTGEDTLFANLRIEQGSLHEKEGEDGTAHFLEHMLIEGGSAKYSPNHQARIRDMMGFTNAATSRERTMIFWGMVNSDLETYLDAVSDMVFNPNLDNQVLQQQKNVVLSEIAKSKGRPDFQDLHSFYNPSLTTLREHRHWVLGKEEVIENLTEQKLRDFHGRGYHVDNMTLMLSGDLPDNFLSLAEKYFGNRKRGERTQIVHPEVPLLNKQSVLYTSAPDLLNKGKPQNSSSMIRIGFVVPHEYHPDSASLAVLSTILGRSWNAGLKKKLRSEAGLSYDINSFCTGENKYGLFGINGRINSNQQEKAIDIIFETLQNFQTEELNADEVLAGKRKLIYSTANNTGYWSDLLLVDPKNVSEVALMDYDVSGRIPIIERCAQIAKITPSDIQRAAQQYLPGSRKDGKYVMLVRDPLKK